LNANAGLSKLITKQRCPEKGTEIYNKINSIENTKEKYKQVNIFINLIN